MEGYRKRSLDKPQYRSDRTKKIHSDCQFKSNYSEPVLPIFEPSGLLELESHGKEGIQLKHVEPKDAQSPLDYYRNSAVPVRKRTRYEAIIYTIGEEHPVKEYELWDKSSYLIGRNLGRSTRKYEQAEATEEEKEVVLADISIPEETCSKQHCVIPVSYTHLDVYKRQGDIPSGKLFFSSQISKTFMKKFKMSKYASSTDSSSLSKSVYRT